jgi:hypothetical protein
MRSPHTLYHLCQFHRSKIISLSSPRATPDTGRTERTPVKAEYNGVEGPHDPRRDITKDYEEIRNLNVRFWRRGRDRPTLWEGCM